MDLFVFRIGGLYLLLLPPTNRGGERLPCRVGTLLIVNLVLTFPMNGLDTNPSLLYSSLLRIMPFGILLRELGSAGGFFTTLLFLFGPIILTS